MEADAINSGFMAGPNGLTRQLPHGAVDSRILKRVLFTKSLPVGVSGVGQNDANRDMREPIIRIIQAIGNTWNPDNFIPRRAELTT